MLNAPRLHRIKSVEEACEGVKIFKFHAPEIARRVRPGQFVMVWLPRYDEIPISVADASQDEIEIAIADVGDCTHRLHQKKAGEMLGLRGPFGRGFSLHEFQEGRVCLVAGGYGAAPLKFAAKALKAKGAEVLVLLGARSARNLLYADAFERFGCSVSVATEDGSAGFKGTVVELLNEILRSEDFDAVLTCGPERMMLRVCEITAKRGIKTQVAVERIIKCASGACDSCDIGGFRVCKEGPVFSAEQLLETEFGKWKRSKSGRRVPLSSDAFSVESSPLPRLEPESEPLLQTEVCGIRFPNPLMNASGFALSGRMLYRFAKAGAGAVVTKSIGIAENEGYPNPTFVEVAPQTYANAIGLANPGILAYKTEIEEAKSAGVPIILSIFGKSVEECERIARIAVNYPIDMIELNASCPHSAFEPLEKRPEMLCEIVIAVSAIAHRSGIPLAVKISANTEDPARLAEMLERCGADAVCATNTLIARPVHEGTPLLGSPTGYGGISGRKIANVGKKVVFQIAEAVNIPIIAVGGIFSAKDVLDYAAAGASLFQIGSAIVSEGPEIFSKIKAELLKILASQRKKISDFVGVAHRR